MAFDQPIEADRIDDFNLISAFVRAPLWILGGVLGSKSSSSKDEDEDDAALPPKRLDDDEDIYDDERSENFSPNVNYYGSSSSSSYMATTTTTKAQSSASSRPPSMVSSSFSSSSSSTASSSHSYSSFLASSSRDNSNNSKHKTKKTMSWSDESGQSLCEYATAEVSYRMHSLWWSGLRLDASENDPCGLRRNYISMVSFLPLQTNKLLNLERSPWKASS